MAEVAVCLLAGCIHFKDFLNERRKKASHFVSFESLQTAQLQERECVCVSPPTVSFEGSLALLCFPRNSKVCEVVRFYLTSKQNPKPQRLCPLVTHPLNPQAWPAGLTHTGLC